MAKVKEEKGGKESALDKALADIERQIGKGAIMRLGDSGTAFDVEVMPTGILSLDIALGIGGIPCGRVVEVYGPESSGKTTVAIHVIAEVQKRGGTAAFIDAEHALDPNYIKNIGVDLDNLLVSQPDTGEEALEICEHLVKSGAVDVVVVDSVAALVPNAEIDGEMGSSHVGLQARLMSQAMRKLTGITSKTSAVVIFINQLREKVGVTYGNPEVTAGGRALKFYSSLRIDVRKTSELIKEGTDIIGHQVKIKITKNKVAPPFKSAEVAIYYGEGFCREAGLIELGEKFKVIDKSGAWYSYGETRLGQGRENVREFLRKNPQMADEIELKIKDIAFPSDDKVINLREYT